MPFFSEFFILNLQKRDQGEVKAPNTNRGMTYQSNGKELRKPIWYLVGEDNIAGNVQTIDFF